MTKTKAMAKSKTPARATKGRTYRRRKVAGATWRRPIAGLLEPGQAIVLVIDPPMTVHEQPVVMTPNGGDILLLDAELDRVTIQNQTDRVVAYLMTVVPRVLVKAATVPWKRIAADLGHAVRESGVLDRFARMLR